jgi:hypothetical protein
MWASGPAAHAASRRRCAAGPPGKPGEDTAAGGRAVKRSAVPTGCGKTLLCPGCSKRSRCKAAREGRGTHRRWVGGVLGPYVAAPRARQRPTRCRRGSGKTCWAFFSSLLRQAGGDGRAGAGSAPRPDPRDGCRTGRGRGARRRSDGAPSLARPAARAAGPDGGRPAHGDGVPSGRGGGGVDGSAGQGVRRRPAPVTPSAGRGA